MARISEKTSLKGRLVFRVIRDGKVIHEARDNLIVTTGRNTLAKLLGGQTGMHVTKFGVGVNDDPADASDTDLTGMTTIDPDTQEEVVNPPVKVNISETRIGTNLEAEDGTTFSDPKVVQFHFVLGTSAAVGMDISEYGLFCADGSLFSRVVRERPFPKTALDKIVGFWQITF